MLGELSILFTSIGNMWVSRNDQWPDEGGVIGADTPGGTFWRGGIFGNQCPENVDLQLSYSHVVDRRT